MSGCANKLWFQNPDWRTTQAKHPRNVQDQSEQHQSVQCPGTTRRVHYSTCFPTPPSSWTSKATVLVRCSACSRAWDMEGQGKGRGGLTLLGLLMSEPIYPEASVSITLPTSPTLACRRRSKF
jgi:hypothetical protein